ncbi:MAG: hypothetical protein H0X66_18395 [Verrucomicrobia bacterium]|nr:hypothetical protein [Verrucomicrobiota bacterium]
MFGKKPRVNPLQLRKELLIAESEINRAQLLQEWEEISDGSRRVVQRLKTIGSITSIAALGAAGFAAFRRKKPESTESTPQKRSWIKTALKGVQVAGSLWMAFRPRRR